MQCKSCGMEVSKGKICPGCGAALDLAVPSGSAPVQQTKKPLKSTLGTIAALVILFITVLAIFRGNQPAVINDAKNLVFSEISESETLGELLSDKFTGLKWDYTEIDDGDYSVSVKGVSKTYGNKVEIFLNVYYSEETVYGSIDSFVINGEEYDGLLDTYILMELFLSE